jgi:multidrug efflux pump subunit AcrA (membrane-fusion protein)
MKKIWARLVRQPYFFAKRRPILSFLALMLVLFGLIYLGALSRVPEKKEELAATPKKVRVVNVGSEGEVVAIGKVGREGRVMIVAQTAGVMQEIYQSEGEMVRVGERLGYIASNYAGTSVSVVQSEIAAKQLEQVNKGYELQLGLVGQQRDLARASAENAAELRRIGREVLVNSENAANDTAEALDNINYQIEQLRKGSGQEQAIAELNQAKLQLLGSLAQLRSAVAQSEYANSEERPPAELARLQLESTLKQLDLQEMNLKVQRDLAGLQYKLAQVQLALAYPSTPITGRVERIYVSKNQIVQPGEPLFVVVSERETAKVTVRVDGSIAKSASRVRNSKLVVEQEEIEVLPEYISNSATDGSQYSIVFRLNEQEAKKLNGREMVKIRIPIVSGEQKLFLPLEAVYVMEERADVFVIEEGRVVSKKVRLGKILGDVVEIEEGLERGKEVIVDRNVVEGELVEKR